MIRQRFLLVATPRHPETVPLTVGYLLDNQKRLWGLADFWVQFLPLSDEEFDWPALEVGSKVTHIQYGWEAEVIGLDNDAAWLRTKDGDHVSMSVGDLEVVP